MEARDSSTVSEPLGVNNPSEDQQTDSHPRDQERRQERSNDNGERVPSALASVEATDSNDLKAAGVKRSSENEEPCPRLTKKQAVRDVAKEILYSAYSAQHQGSPDTLESMDCGSGESLDMEGFMPLLTQERCASQRATDNNASFTSSKLETLRKSKVDNPEAISAMFASRPSPERPGFPMGTTVGGAELNDCESLDGSEITTRTMDELGIGSKNPRRRSQLPRSLTYPSSLVDKKFYDPKETNISSATQAAREQCLNILKGGRRSLTPAKSFPAYDTTSSDNGWTHETFEERSDNEQVDNFSPPSNNQLPQKSQEVEQDADKATKARTIIRLDEQPKPSTNEVLFEYNGEIFQHAPLPSGWEVHISRSKNRPFYTHPDRGTTWHCPILNPLGPCKTASLSLEGSSLMDTVVGRAPVKAVDVNTDDSDTDTDDTGATAVSSVVSLISKDGVSVETHLRAKVTDKDEPHYDDVTGTTTASTVEISVARNAVERVVTVEQGELESAPSDLTDEQQLRGLPPLKPECVADDEGSLATISIRSDGSPASTASKTSDEEMDHSPTDSRTESNREEVRQAFSSPDEEIASLVLVNLEHRQKRDRGDTLLALYPSDRVCSPSLLAMIAGARESHNQVFVRNETVQEDTFPAKESRRGYEPSFGESSHESNEFPTALDEVDADGSSAAQSQAVGDTLHKGLKSASGRIVASEDGNPAEVDDNVVQPDTTIDMRPGSPEDGFPATDDTDVPFEDDHSAVQLDEVGELRQRKSTTDTGVVRHMESNRETEFPVSYDDDTFPGGDDGSDPSVDNPDEAEQRSQENDVADDEVDGIGSPSAADESTTESNDEDTETGVEGDDVYMAGGANSVFHPKVIETTSVCSMSTLGGYKPSYTGNTHISKFSLRILNPPHPICSLQQLDQIRQVAAAVGKSRTKIRQYGRPLPHAKHGCKSTSRRLDFLQSR